MKVALIFTILIINSTISCLTNECFSQEHQPDPETSLLLHFNQNALDDPSLEAPATATNISYSTGLYTDGALFDSNSILQYQASDNINSSKGSFEVWLRPTWNGDDGQDHFLLIWGGGGGIFIGKDAANNLKILVNKFATNGNPEKVVSTNISSWSANEWHHVAFTWSTNEINLYVDGALISATTVGFILPTISAATFDIGSENGIGNYTGLMEELRISTEIRTEAEIFQSFLNGQAINDLILKENNINLYPKWRYKPEVCIVSNINSFPIDPSLLSWNTSNPTVATINAQGNIISHNPGSMTITGTVGQSASVTLNVNVQSPALAPSYPPMDSFITTPADCSKELMRVLVINYFPTQDGIMLDLNEIGPDLGTDPISLNSIEKQLKEKTTQMKFMSEERTRFRGYKNPDADPYLGYEVVNYINVYEPIPRFHKVNWRGQSDQFIQYLDMPMIAERFNWQDYVDQKDIDEVWIWGYHNDNPGGVFGSESEMSSPTTDDISNSWRFNSETNLPIYSKTYMVYWYNYGRGVNLHNHGHQLESIFTSVNSSLFWNDFATYGRCGNDHQPPNTTAHYDYLNTSLVMSDIEDWQVAGGTFQPVNVDNWGNLNYNWPYGKQPSGINIKEVNYYIYWMQNMPGYLNAIPFDSVFMSNWWQFIADWDTYNYLTADLYQSSEQVPIHQLVGPCTKCDDDLIITPIAYDGSYHAAKSIESDAIIQPDADVYYQAGEDIMLTSDFEVVQGSTFNAFILSCL